MNFKSLKEKFTDKNGDFDDGVDINNQTEKRNKNISTILFILILLVIFGGYKLSSKSTPKANNLEQQPIDFGAVVESDFVTEDNQSALLKQQTLLDEYKRNQDELLGKIDALIQGTDATIENQEREMKVFREKMESRLKKREEELEKKYKNQNNEATLKSGSVFGDKNIPPKPLSVTDIKNAQQKDFSYSNTEKSLFNKKGIDSYTFNWDEDEKEKPFKRTIDNYVPSGTFVTAIVTGGADANAGVLGQGDTVPMVFQTINSGILPNGEESRLQNCTIIGAVYGEISSSRGIVRTNKMSCIFDDGEIIDTHVEGTVFNYGRNGIRGNTILRNGQVVGMAGAAGILEGLGNTADSLATTLSSTALGTTSVVNSEDALLSALANGGQSVGTTLSQYYIQLAELYHPIVELNQGNMVNIVFLNGFPLDSNELAKVEAAKQEEGANGATNQVLNVIQNNPLSNSLPANVKDAVSSESSMFGSK